MTIASFLAFVKRPHIYILLFISHALIFLFFFFFNDTATTEIYTLSLHDALPILSQLRTTQKTTAFLSCSVGADVVNATGDRKSTRLNSSHVRISYAVFCLKKKKKTIKDDAEYTKFIVEQCSMPRETRL